MNWQSSVVKFAKILRLFVLYFYSVEWTEIGVSLLKVVAKYGNLKAKCYFWNLLHQLTYKGKLLRKLIHSNIICELVLDKMKTLAWQQKAGYISAIYVTLSIFICSQTLFKRNTFFTDLFIYMRYKQTYWSDFVETVKELDVTLNLVLVETNHSLVYRV